MAVTDGRGGCQTVLAERTVLVFEILGGSFSCAKNSRDPANMASLPWKEWRTAREDDSALISSTVHSPYNKRTIEPGFWGIWAARRVPDPEFVLLHPRISFEGDTHLMQLLGLLNDVRNLPA